MSAAEIIHRAKEIRKRLMRPANAVFDKGINLHPHRLPQPMSYFRSVPRPIVVLDNRIMAKVTIKVIRRPLGPYIPKIGAIIKVVCRFYRVTPSDIRGPNRKSSVCLPRHVAFYLLATHTVLSMPAIGRLFGGRDHTTVLHGRDRIKEMLLVDEKLSHQVKMIELMVFGEFQVKPSEPAAPPEPVERQLVLEGI